VPISELQDLSPREKIKFYSDAETPYNSDNFKARINVERSSASGLFPRLILPIFLITFIPHRLCEETPCRDSQLLKLQLDLLVLNCVAIEVAGKIVSRNMAWNFL
jgi:hypothetical protein